MSYDTAFGQMMHQIFGNFDMSIFAAFGFIQNDIFTWLAHAFTAFGQPEFCIMMFITALVMCLFKRTRKIGLLLVGVTGLFFIVNNLCLKNMLPRLRPYNALQGNAEYFQWYLNVGAIAETETCFPSGHSCYAFSIATVMFLWLKNDMKKSEGWMLFLPAALIACSRIYLMVHYPSDVLAGILEGIIIGCIVWYGLKLLIFLGEKFAPKFTAKCFDLDIEPRVEKKLEREIDSKKVITIIVFLTLCFWVASFSKLMVDMGKAEHCSHQGPDYICMNEADNKVFDEKTGEWKLYCDLHD